MREETVAERYAQAVLEAAHEAQDEERIAQDLLFLSQLSQKLPEFLALLDHPRIELRVKEKVLQEVEKHVHPYTFNLLRLLIRHGRTRIIPELVGAYFKALEKVGGPVHVLVRTAQPLSPEAQDQLRARLQTALGREVTLEEEVVPELLAGAELVLSGRRLDASLRGRLLRLRRTLGG
ncbi:MAG: ATP synthase F1 subunit delta [Candidatus Bipolaricaulota bacterium]|nr:ATP synthase F1 subunit delta [Candidatus Bipolaricaulota bacterium]MDW8126259.1 ATP synthase F1 subunit delta [Candidatus Bipolaricaulota bacterium]